MEIMQATEAHAQKWGDEVADLVYETGPTTYEYQFGGREYYDEIVKASWSRAGTLFGYDCTTIAVEGDELLAIEIGFRGPEFAARKKTLGPLWAPLIESGRVSREQLGEIGRAAYLASYLNVAIPSAVYYVHALAVVESRRGEGIGKQLMQRAIDDSKSAGLRGVHLDVLSGTPAVGFYDSLGMECLTETVAPIPHEHGIPMEMRMSLDF